MTVDFDQYAIAGKQRGETSSRAGGTKEEEGEEGSAKDKKTEALHLYKEKGGTFHEGTPATAPNAVPW